MSAVKIFVSHGTRYSEIAKSLKLSLQALEEKTLSLDIKISGEMARRDRLAAMDRRQRQKLRHLPLALSACQHGHGMVQL